MDTERNLLFGVVAFQQGVVAADGLAETCADWAAQPSQTLAELMVGRGLLTQEQKIELEETVATALAAHGDDPQATLAATLDGRSLEAIAPAASAAKDLRMAIAAWDNTDAGLGSALATLAPTDAGIDLGLAIAARPVAPPPGGHVVLGTLSPGEAEARERYTLTHLHARGGMGRVWLARDGALGRQIALKELRPDQADNQVVCSRFLYEAKITAQLEHPGIVPVYELGSGEAPYYTMRFVRGKTLGEAIRAYHKKRAAGAADPVGLVELLTAYVGVCHAVAYAHARGVIHRDLKGQNVVLGDYGEVIVLDWGLAKRVGTDQADEATGSAGAATAAAAPEAASHVTCAPDGFTLPAPPDAVTGAAGNSDGFEPPAQPGAETVAASDPGSGSGPGSHGSAPRGSSSGPRIVRESGAGPEGTIQGQLLGTPAYMAPEQAQCRHDLVDQRTDIYGLGAILYEILTGRPPFVAPKTKEIIRKVCEESPTPPRQIVPTIAPGLEAVCLKALSKEPAQRYGTASELAQEVRRWLADEPVRAFPEPWTSRAARWARRHRTVVAAAGGLMIAAIIALGVGTALIARERDEAEAQEQQARQAVHLLTKVAEVGFDERLDPLQKEFLEDALAYYEKFTGRSADDPGVRLEHGRAFQQMGDLQRKLGRLAEAERSYRRSAELLWPLAAGGPAAAQRQAAEALARTRTLLGDLLVRRGADQGQAEDLYRQAQEAQRLLAAGAKEPAATAEACLRLGQTLKSQADLIQLNGGFARATPVYDQAIAELEQAHAADARRAEIRNELALALDARGLVHRDQGQVPPAEQDFRRALELLDKLVAEFPTVPRHRETLAKVCNSLGLLEQDLGHLANAEALLRRELPLVERLAQDFPDRPEHRRELARSLVNLGIVLLGQNRIGDAEAAFRRGVEVIGAIAAKFADDVQIQLDLARCHHDLAELLLEKGDARSAVESFLRARTIGEALVKGSPEKPRYRSALAGTLASLGSALQRTGQPGAEESYRAAVSLYEKLVADHPDNVEYRAGQARCLGNLGPIEARAGRPERAETMYRQALVLLDTKDAGSSSPERLRDLGGVLNNLGDVQRKLNRPEAEQTLRRTLETFAGLVDRKLAARKDRHGLAIAQYNLGELLVERQRLPEATTFLDRAVATFEALAAEMPGLVDLQSHFGHVLHRQADLLAKAGKLKEAQAALAGAVAHQRQAVQLSRGRNDTRALLGGHLVALADIEVKLGVYHQAADHALEVPNAVPAPNRGEGCLDAARILARLVIRAGGDAKLPQAERDGLTRQALGRTIVWLREATDAGPKLVDRVQNDPDLKALQSRPDFQAAMNTLVNLGQGG
jgi:serine/threonine protein kinase